MGYGEQQAGFWEQVLQSILFAERDGVNLTDVFWGHGLRVRRVVELDAALRWSTWERG
jgi:hypothetical protein